jgi:hypothetical protein
MIERPEGSIFLSLPRNEMGDRRSGRDEKPRPLIRTNGLNPSAIPPASPVYSFAVLDAPIRRVSFRGAELGMNL